MKTCAILVTDTGPLKTLAYAGQLELLTKTGLPVLVTDMVLAELYAGARFAGNKIAIDFIEKQFGENALFRKIATGVPENATVLKSLRVDPGEHSLKIALEDYRRDHPDDFALLLFEDNGIARKTFVLPDNVSLLTTRPFLREFEKRGLIDSAEAVLRAAEMASIAAEDERKLLGRKQEHSIPPRRDTTVRPF